MSTEWHPSFSICIPNYNYGDYIGQTLRSVLEQSYQNFEIIVADNASTDHSVEVIKSFRDPRIRLVENRCNIGFAPNLQRATMFARCQYINLLSSDDLMLPHALETYARVLRRLGRKQARRTVLFSDAEMFDGEGRLTGLIRKASDGFYTEQLASEEVDSLGEGEVEFHLYRGREVLVDSLARLRTFAPFLTLIYPRRFWEEVEGYNSVRTIGPDKHFTYKLLSLDPLVAYVPRPLFRYRDFASPNRQAQQLTLKQPIDDYLYTLEYDERQLRSLGLSHQELVDTFLERVCLKEGLSRLGRGGYVQALRLLAFALASYPERVLHHPKAYALALLLGLGPLGVPLARLLYQLRRRLLAEPGRPSPARRTA